jgi:hypothetical protein
MFRSNRSAGILIFMKTHIFLSDKFMVKSALFYSRGIYDELGSTVEDTG